jgi:hypothetical protein
VGRALADQLGARDGDGSIRVVGLLDRSGYVFDPKGLARGRLLHLARGKDSGEFLARLGGKASDAADALADIASHAVSRPVLVDVTAEETGDLLLLGLGFLVMYFAALRVQHGEQVLSTWLIVAYLLHTWGELALSPVGLSYMSKLAPARFVGQVMGMFFLSVALGNNLAGQLASQYDAGDLASLPALFLKTFWWGAIAAAIMLLFTPWLKRLMEGIR